MAKQANPGKHPETDITTSDRLWQATSFGLPLLLYIVTLAPTVTLEDSGSFITAAKFLGVAHPSGYPLWCLIAHAFTWLPFGGIAERVHLCSAFFAAATCWLVYLTAVMLTSRRISALLAALALGISRIFWSQAVIAEVYTLNAFFTILLIHLTLRWQLTQENRWLFLLAFTSGLALTNHPKIILVVPVVWVWALWSHWRRVLVPRVLFVIGLLIVLGLSVYLYLPLRARSDPPVNWHKPDTLAKTLNHIQRASYFAPEEGVRYLGGTSDVVRHTLTAWKTSATAVSWPLAIIALFGLIHTWRQRRDFALLSLALFLLHTFLFNAYVHATYSDVWRFAHRVYYIPAHVMTSLWIAFGLAVIEGWLRNRLQHSVRLSGLARRNWLVAGLFLALVLVPLIQNYSHAGHRGDQRARNFGLDFVSVLPRGAGILPVGDTVVFTCLYLKYVEGTRTDLHILSPFFGWHNEPVSVLYCVDPLTPGVVETFPWLEGYRSIPYGLGYLYINDPAHPPHTDGDFHLLPQRSRDEGLLTNEYDPFVEGLRSTYAVYSVRAGARALALDRQTQADELLNRAEVMNPADPWVSYLLARTYMRYDLRTDRARPLLLEALDRYDTVVDPAAQRYYAIDKVDIERALAELEDGD